jgi:hypothetical protein
MPFTERLPSGRMKRLLRDAMAGILPRAIAERRGVTTFDTVMQRNFQKNRTVLHDLFGNREWLSGPFVDQHQMRALWSRLDATAPDQAPADLMGTVMDAAQLELWLRNLDRSEPLSSTNL